MSDLAALLPIILLVAIFYLFIIRPQGKRRREFVSMQQKVTVGARVMITSGVFGTVKALGDETMTLEIAPGVDIEVHRNVVAKIVDGSEDGSEADAATTEAVSPDAASPDAASPEAAEPRPAEDEDGKA